MGELLRKLKVDGEEFERNNEDTFDLNDLLHPCPCGTDAISRSPRRQRPLSRTMFVLVAVSSINTSRAGSSMPCSRTQRRGARATSARFCSAAWGLF